jgi:hypothetical protein
MQDSLMTLAHTSFSAWTLPEQYEDESDRKAQGTSRAGTRGMPPPTYLPAGKGLF